MSNKFKQILEEKEVLESAVKEIMEIEQMMESKMINLFETVEKCREQES
jgi:hypothetical protein